MCSGDRGVFMFNTNMGQGLIHWNAAELTLLALFATASAVGQDTEFQTEAIKTPSQTLPKLHALYKQSMQTKQYSEAATVATRYLDTLLKQPDFDNQDRGLALERLARAQHSAGDLNPAIQNYEQSVEILQGVHDRLHISLVEPLLGLGRAFGMNEAYEPAVDIYKHALHVLHVNEGLYTLRQNSALIDLSELHYSKGHFERANALQQTYMSVLNSHYPDDDLRKLPAMYSRADMLTRTEHIYDARNAYRRIVFMIERVEGSRTPTLLPALIKQSELLSTYAMMDGYNGHDTARRILRRAVHIADTQDHTTPTDHADAYIAMGDYLIRKSLDRKRALKNYVAAWNALEQGESPDHEFESRFGAPTLLNQYPATMVPAMRNQLERSFFDGDELQNRVHVRYDVDQFGFSRNIEIVEGDLSGYWDPIVIKHVGKFLHRPRLVDGEAVEHSGLTYELRY